MSENTQSQTLLYPVLEDDVIMCPHGGRVQLKSIKGKPFQSDGVPIILEPDMQNALISGCTNSILGVPTPCTMVVNIPPAALSLKTLNGEKAVIQDFCKLLVTVIADWAGKFYREIHIIGPCPAVRNPVAGNQGIVLYTYLRPKGFSVIIVYPVDKIKHHTLNGIPCRISIVMHSCPQGSGKPCADAIVIEESLVIPRTRRLVVMRETRPVTAVRIILRARPEFQRPCDRHYQHVPEVGMARTAEMGMAETDYRTVRILITSTVPVCFRLVDPADIVRHDIGIGT